MNKAASLIVTGRRNRREMSFNQQGGRYVVNDIVLDVLNLDDAIIYSDDRELIIVGGVSTGNRQLLLARKTLGYLPLSVQPTQSRASVVKTSLYGLRIRG